MASVLFFKFQYSQSSGSELAVGGTHDWWMTHDDFSRVNGEHVQINVTAHPWVYLPHYWRLLPSELEVENVRSRIEDTGRVFLFRVRNVGPNPVPFYGLGVTFITE